MLTALQYRILKRLGPRDTESAGESAVVGERKLERLLGDWLLSEIPGKRVIDFGCGGGSEAVALAQRGAAFVTGLDIRPHLLEIAAEKARAAGVAGLCRFCEKPSEPADLIVSIDSFEHFEDPSEILKVMHEMLAPGGKVIVSFGPTWYHPYGGHLFSVRPWAHLVFSEEALIRWRSDFKTDGATRFCEVEGGLNQMTIGRFERLVARSPFRLDRLEAVPIRRLARLHNRMTREFCTAVVRARLLKPA